MREVIYDDQPLMIEWAERVIGCQFRADAKAIGYRDEGVFLAVTVFDGFSMCDCNMHIASNGSGVWLNRKYLLSVFAYPFVQMNMRRVTGLVPAKNEKALKFDHHLGFKYEGRCRNAMPDDDIIILGMLREECPYIPSKYRS